jgi:hypothetical protein
VIEGFCAVLLEVLLEPVRGEMVASSQPASAANAAITMKLDSKRSWPTTDFIFAP